MIKAQVPGIGTIEIEGAASEYTLRQLLAAIEKNTGTKTPEGRQRAAEQQRELRNLRDSNVERERELESREENTDEIDANTKANQLYNRGLSELRAEITTSTGVVAKFGQAYVVTLTQVLSQYDAVARSPITAAAGQLSTAIDLSAIAANRLAHSLGAAGQGLLLMVPIIGDGLSKAAEWATERAKESIDIAKTIIKRGNELMAQEFEKSRVALQNMTETGASFAGGLTELRQTAIDAQIPIEEFTSALRKNSADFRKAGMTQAEGAKSLAAIMAQTTKITGSSGLSLRDQMLGLGYTYEEQAELITHYMAMDAIATGKRRRSDEEIARLTAEYAKDLKILQDITGQNAKQALEEARAKALEQDILSRLNTSEEVEKFTRALAATPPSLKKGFLEFVSSGGKVITDAAFNIASAQLPQLRRHIEQVYSDIKDPSVKVNTMVDSTLEGFSRVGAEARNLGSEMAQAVRLANVTGSIAQAVNIQNELIRVSMITPEEIERARKAAETQSNLVDAQSQSLAEIIKLTTDHAVMMHSLTQKYADDYAGFLETTLKTTLGVIQEAAKMSSMDLQEFFKKEVEKNYRAITGQSSEPVELPPELQQAKEQSKVLNDLVDQLKKERDAAYTGSIPGFLRFLRPESSYSAEEKIADMKLKDVEKQQADHIRATTKLMAELYAAGKLSKDEIQRIGAGLATGGIATGPRTGYVEVLHGTEAVVPLPDGRTIPVSVSSPKNSEIEKLLAAVNALLASNKSGPVKVDNSEVVRVLNAISTAISNASEMHESTNKTLSAMTKQNQEIVESLDNNNYILQRIMQLSN